MVIVKLIVGLGNPGKQYVNTRHNIGFSILDKYLDNVVWKEKFNGLYYEKNVNGEKNIFLKPQSFMNLSGEVVKQYVDYFKINLDDILIIHDDLDLELGNYRLKACGSSGGHNGLKNIENMLNTKDYKRLKIGIGINQKYDTISFVLGKFSNEEKILIDKLSDIFCNIIDDFLIMDFQKLMNKYNHKKR